MDVRLTSLSCSRINEKTFELVTVELQVQPVEHFTQVPDGFQITPVTMVTAIRQMTWNLVVSNLFRVPYIRVMHFKVAGFSSAKRMFYTFSLFHIVSQSTSYIFFYFIL